MIGTGELFLIFCVILLLFGGKKLPELARSLGKGMKEFKRACSDAEDSCESCNHRKEKKCCLEADDIEPSN